MQIDRTKVFRREMNSYLKTKMRICDTLDILCYLLCDLTPSNSRKRSRIDRETMRQIVRKTSDPFRVLKLLILVHKCVIDGRISDAEEFLQEFVSLKIESSINR